MTRCYQYRLHPTPPQEHQFVQWAGCRRFVWNHFRERRQQHYQQTGKSLGYTALCKELTALKQQPEFAFLNDCDSQALQQVLKDLCRAYANFFEKRARFPKRKSKRRTPNSFRIPQRVRVEGDYVLLPKAGRVAVVLHRPLQGQVKSATIQQEPSGKWAISFVSPFDAPEPQTDEPLAPVGLDAGLETFVTTSDGDKTPPPRFYRKQERKLRKAQRAFSRKKKGSKNRAKAKKRVSVVHSRIQHQRQDWLHKRSRELADKHDLICLEDLAVSALTKTKRRGHGKSWTDASWGIFRRMLTYKMQWQGKRLVVISRWYPSSQECSVCHERTKHDLSVRSWTCGCCGALHDRDLNAAVNILAEGLRLLAGGNPGSLTVCGEGVRLSKRKQPSWKQKSSDCEVGSAGL